MKTCIKLKLAILYLFSALLLYNPAMADQPQVIISWEYSVANSNDIAGFKIYFDDSMIQNINVPGATSWTGNVEMNDGDHKVELTAYDESGQESIKSLSKIFTYDGPPEPPINIDVNLL